MKNTFRRFIFISLLITVVQCFSINILTAQSGSDDLTCGDNDGSSAGNPYSGGSPTKAGQSNTGWTGKGTALDNTKKNDKNDQGGGGGDEYDFYDEDYGAYDDDSSYDDTDSWGGDSFGSNSNSCTPKAIALLQNGGTWENFAQSLGMTKLNHTGPITDLQKKYFTTGSNIYLLCNEKLLKITLEAIDVLNLCSKNATNKEIDQLVDYFHDPDKLASPQTQELLNCYFSGTIGQNFADCVFPASTPNTNSAINQNSFALLEYVKANSKDKFWVDVNGCEMVKSGTTPDDCAIKLKYDTESFPQNGRQRIGLKEKITVSITGCNKNPNVNVNWKILPKNHKAIIIDNNSSLEIQAGYEAEQLTIEAEIATFGAECKNCLPVIKKVGIIDILAPNGLSAEIIPNSEYHIECKPSAGFRAKLFILPNDVNFEGIKIGEAVAATFDPIQYGNNQDACTGLVQACNTCVPHTPSPSQTPVFGGYQDGKGTFYGKDNIFFGLACNCNAGVYSNTIFTTTYYYVFYYENGIGKKIEFNHGIQTGENTANTIDNNPTFTTKKFGITVEAKLKAKTTSEYIKLNNVCECKK